MNGGPKNEENDSVKANLVWALDVRVSSYAGCKVNYRTVTSKTTYVIPSPSPHRSGLLLSMEFSIIGLHPPIPSMKAFDFFARRKKKQLFFTARFLKEKSVFGVAVGIL